MNLVLKIKTLSPLLLGKNDSETVLYDNDIVTDDIGLPYIPAKRLKGVLKESALEILEMFPSHKSDFSNAFLYLFGDKGYASSNLIINNMLIENYPSVKKNLLYSMQKYKNIVTIDNIIDSYTVNRSQTAIDNNGIAKEHSLRTVRAVMPDIIFTGILELETENEEILNLLILSVINMKRMGLMRNRGFGEISAQLFRDNTILTTSAVINKI